MTARTQHPMTLEAFGDDPQLGNFAEASPGQRLVERLVDGLAPGNAEQRRLYRELAGCDWAPGSECVPRVVALIMGADSGKSVIAALFLVHRALFGDLKGLRPGQRAVALLVAPDQRLARIPLEYAKGIVYGSPVLSQEVESDTADSIRFKRAVELAVLPATIGGRSTRGRRFVAAVLEEVAFFRDSDYRVNDLEIVRSVRPRLLPGATLLAISTPFRKLGWLFDTHRKHHGKPDGKTLVLQAPTETMRPDRSRESIADEYEDDPESAAVEFGAEFRDDVSNLFTDAELLEVTSEGVTFRDREDGWTYKAAMDPSGLRNDAWAFTILGRREMTVRQFVSLAWLPGTPVPRIVGEITALLGGFRLSSLFSDQYGSEITKSHFTEAGLRLDERAFTAGQSSPKALGFKALREMVTAHRIELLDDPVQRRELRTLEVTLLAGGGERIAAPGRLHDDRACALALACAEIGRLGEYAGLIAFMRERTAKQLKITPEQLDERMEKARAASGSGSDLPEGVVDRESLADEAARLTGEYLRPPF